MRNRKELEDSWQRTIEDKKQRDQEEMEYRKNPAEPLHEQSHRYQRCGKCQRNVRNWGESKFWRETRYPSGSKIMI